MEHLKLSLLVSSFVIPLILSITILVNSKNDLSKKVIAVALLNAFFVFLANYYYFQKMFGVYSYVHSLHIAAVLWLFPSVFLYVKSIVGNNFRKDLFHLLPGVVFGLISATIFYRFLNFDERIFYLSNYRMGTEFKTLNMKVLTIFRLADVVLIVAQVIYYSVILFRIPQKYNYRLMQEYSNIENFSVNWLYWFNGGFIVVGILSILFYVFNPFHEGNELFLVFFLFCISAFIWVIGIWSFKQQRPKQEIEAPVPVSDSNLNRNENTLAKVLIKYFETEQPYLNPELSLTDVCRKIGTNRTYLSNLINNQFEMNFNAFVNQYRIKEVLEYKKQNPVAPYPTLVSVGGFGSVSSLKRALEKHKGNSIK